MINILYIVKSRALPDGGPLFTTVTITYKVAVCAPAEWADTLTLFHLYLYMYSVGLKHASMWSLGGGETWKMAPVWANFSIMMESTPESAGCRSVCTLCLDLSLLPPIKEVDNVASHTVAAAL
jgi:hypothetical protein